MPQAELDFPDVVSSILQSNANAIAIAGGCSKGLASRSYTYDPSQVGNVEADLGDGIAVEAAVTLLRYGKRSVTVFPVTPTVAGSLSAVSKNGGSGPTITIAALPAAGSVLIDGPYDDLHVAIEIAYGGAAGTARFRYSTDDATENGVHVGAWSGEITVPAAAPAEIVGTIDLSTISSWGNSGTLDGRTFIIDTDSTTPVTTTFVDPADPADVVSQINANNGGGTKYLVALVGSYKLAVYSITTGTSGVVTIGAGDANTLMGFTSSATATGTAATYTIPGIGVVATFPAGTYNGPTAAAPTTARDVYTFDTRAGRIAPAGVAAVFTRVQAAISAGALIGGLWLAQEDADTIDGRSMADAFSTALTAARASKFLFWGLYQATKNASDASVLLRMSSFEDRYLPISGGDFYSAGGLLAGSYYHRPASWVAARKAARDRFSSDLGNHSDGSLTSLGVTKLIRDERTASTKLATFRVGQTASGGGFLVLETNANQASAIYFYQGRTMAPAGSLYGDFAAVRVLLACGRQVQADLDFQMNNDPPLTRAGVITDASKDAIENILRTGLNAVLFEDVEAPEGHASAIGDIEPVYTVATKTLGATFEIQRRGPIKRIVASVGVTDTLSTVEA